MRTLAEALAGAVRGGHVELGAEEFLGATVRIPDGLSINGGVIHGEAQLLSPVGMLWTGPRFPDHPSNTAGMLTVLGGSDWTVSRADITDGRAYGQIRVSLDLTQSDPARRVPMRWLVEGCRAGPAGTAYVYPQNDSIYVLGTPGVAMGGVVRGCTFGPAPKGVPVKVGGTGGNPLTEGSCGVTFEACRILTGAISPSDVKYGICVQGRTSGIVFKDCVADGPIEIKVGDGAQVTFQQCKFPPGSRIYVFYYWPAWWLRWWRREESGLANRSYTGVSWQP